MESHLLLDLLKGKLRVGVHKLVMKTKEQPLELRYDHIFVVSRIPDDGSRWLGIAPWQRVSHQIFPEGAAGKSFAHIEVLSIDHLHVVNFKNHRDRDILFIPKLNAICGNMKP